MDELTFLQKGALSAAQELIGWRFYKKNSGNLIGGVIIETEAYTQIDAASHTYKGPTARNKIMFESYGRIYVYFTYGMHYCVNIVTGNRGQGEGVLIRALLPDNGLTFIREHRNYQPDAQLTNGPAKICQALNITLKDNGETIDQDKFILLPPNSKPIITTTVRVGIKKDTHRLWRFVGSL